MVVRLGFRLGSLMRHPQRAQGMVEYALILVLIAVVVIVALTAVGTGISSTFDKIANSLK
jgi:pilus assembly protein Flp/PilA